VRRAADSPVMRSLRYVLRLIFALEAVLFLSIAFFTLSQFNRLAVVNPHFHLGRFALMELICFIVLLAVVAAVAAWRIYKGDSLGRWSLLAVSIFNLPLFPLGTGVAAAGIFYFLRNPAIDPTPDRKHQPIAGDGTGRWSGAVFVLAQMAWGVFILSFIGRWSLARGMQPIRSEAQFWITLGAAIYASILVHELGHFLAGDIVGFRLIGFGIGPLSWAYVGGQWRTHLRYDKLFGGHTAMAPKTPRNIRERAMILTLGGPLASAGLSAIGAVSLLLVPGPSWPPALGRAVALATGFAIGDFVFNLLPMASEAQYSDGARLWQMYRRGPWCDFHCANHYMGLSRTTPLRPRDWPTDMVERAAEFATRLPEPAASYGMAYVHFQDCGDWQRALSWLDKAREAARPGSKIAHALLVDRAYFEAFHRREGEEARRLLDQAAARIDSSDYWRSAAAVLGAQGDLIGASEAWNKAWEIASQLPSTGLYEMDREQLQLVSSWLEELRTQPISA
jgi:tetratricopeptide (TPR) repeat protein